MKVDSCCPNTEQGYIGYFGECRIRLLPSRLRAPLKQNKYIVSIAQSLRQTSYRYFSSEYAISGNFHTIPAPATKQQIGVDYMELCSEIFRKSPLGVMTPQTAYYIGFR